MTHKRYALAEAVEELRELATDVLGSEWISRLARATGANVRTAQRWAVGERSIPISVMLWLEEEERALVRTGFREKLDALIVDARVDLVSEHTIIGLLRDRAEMQEGPPRPPD